MMKNNTGKVALAAVIGLLSIVLQPIALCAADSPKTSKAGKASALPAAEVLPHNNPDLAVELGTGLWGLPVPVDYDGDGLKDVIVVCPDTPYKGVYCFRNIGSAKKPFFDKAVKLSGKADKNLRFSEWDGKTYVFTPGARQDGFFKEPFGAQTEFTYEGEVLGADYKKSRTNMWNVVDWDGDGDLDIVVGIDTWDDYGWDNAYDGKGNWTNGPLHGYVYLLENVDGKYYNKGRIEAGGAIIDTYGAPIPCVADFDGDGDLDIICGEFVDGLTWFENVGTRKEPRFAAGRQMTDAKKKEIRFHIEMIVPACTDFDGDGRPDLLVGDEDGTVAYLHNSGKVKNHMPVFDSWYKLQQKADLVKFGALSTPVAYDWNGDGRQDIISGNSAGEICFIENLSGGENPVWGAPKCFKVGKNVLRIMAGPNGSIQGPAERKWGYTVLSVADWDGDGRADIIVNSIFGKIEWYRNTGAKDGLTLAPAQPVKVAWEGATPKPAWNWWNPQPGTLTTQWRTTPYATDWNGDGVLDLVMLDHEGYLAFFEGFVMDGEHILKPGRRIFYCTNGSVYRNRKGMIDPTPGLLRLNDQPAGQSGRRKICFTDWDKDGKADLVVDGTNAVWFRQVRSKDGEWYFEYRGDLSSTRLEGHTTCPTPIDWNGDGVSELLLGAEDGHFYFIRNTMNPQKTVKLFPEGAPTKTGLEGTPVKIKDNGYYEGVSETEMLVYLPQRKDGAKPSKAVLVVPGGGYSQWCVTFEGYKTANWLNDAGIAAFVLKYRLPNGHPEVILEDSARAMEYIRDNAAEFGIDPRDVGIIGFSAGGHFAATALTKYASEKTRPDYGVLVYPVISAKYQSVNTMNRLLGDRFEDESVAAQWSCENNVRADMPPVMIVLCADDKAVDPRNSRDFYDALQTAGVKSQMQIYATGGHGFWMRDRYRWGRSTYASILDWIKNWNK